MENLILNASYKVEFNNPAMNYQFIGIYLGTAKSNEGDFCNHIFKDNKGESHFVSEDHIEDEEYTITQQFYYFHTMDFIDNDFEEENIEQGEKELEIFKNFNNIVSFEVNDEYTDDHLPCYEVNIETDLGMLHVTFAWLSKDGVKAIWKAEEGKFKKVTAWLMEERQELSEN